MSAADLQVGGNPNVAKYYKGCQTRDRNFIIRKQRMKRKFGCNIYISKYDGVKLKTSCQHVVARGREMNCKPLNLG